MVLVSESCEVQAVRLRALGDARPIHMHRDVRMTDLFEGRIEMSMSRADLHASVKFIAQMPVINRNDVAALQVRGEAVDPFECRLIENPFLVRRLGSRRSLRKRALDEHKLVVLKIDKFFHLAADQAHRHRVQQFVGKVDANEWLKRITPFNLGAKWFQGPRLSLLQNRKWLD